VRAGARVVVEPDAVAWDRPERDTTVERQGRVRALAGHYQLLALAPWLLHPGRNRLWFRYASHRLLRLAMPWVLCLLAIATVALAPTHPFYLACLGAGLAAVAAGLAGPRLPLLSGSLPVRAAAGFLRMNLQAGQALVAYAARRGSALW
jgi:hypothetical protein